MASVPHTGDRRESFGKEQWHDSGVGSDEEEDSVEKSRDFRPRDEESQVPLIKDTKPVPVDHEYEVSARTKLIYLGIYFFFNLALTIYNKAVLGKVRPNFYERVRAELSR
jgi:hypothetical protein